MPRPLRQAVEAGLLALGRMQTREGYFPFFCRAGADGWQRCDPMFLTAYIMMTSAGRLLPPQRIAHAIEYIAMSRRADGLWHFDPSRRLPADADTTACALAALALDGRTAETEGGAALLRSFWRPEAGPFRTWREAGEWSAPDRDDAIVNCHVLYALRLLGAPPTAAEQGAAEALVRRSVEGARYYSSPGALALACRRARIAPEAWPPIAVAPPTDGLGLVQWSIATGRERRRVTERLLAAQRSDGGWPAAPWVTEARAHLWASPAITTAFAIEALRAALREATTATAAG